MVKLYSNSQKEKWIRKKKIYRLDYKQYGNELKFHKQKVETNIKMNELGFNLQAIKDELIWNPRTWYKNIEHRTKKTKLRKFKY